MVRDMTKGKPFPVILRFCVPILLGSLFQQAYNLTDAAIIGRFVGMDEMGAVLSTGSLHFLVIGFVMGLTTGFSIPISQSYGAGDVSQMRRRVANSFYLCGIFAIMLTVLTVVFVHPLLTVMRTPAETIDAAYDYIIVLFGSLSVIMAYNILAALMRALGDSRTPLFFLMFSCVLNIILDLIFIVAFNWGTAGAGWATVVSMSFAVIGCIVYIKRNFPVLCSTKQEKAFCRESCAKLIKSGVPMALQFSITAIGSVILQSAVNALGAVVVSAVGMAARIQIFIMQPMEALGITMATFCAQNLGAGKLHRIKAGISTAMVMVLIYSLFAGFIIIIFGRMLAGLFVDSNAENLETAMYYIKQFQLANGSLYWLLGVLFILRNSVQGLGYSGVTVFAGVSELIARAGVAFLLVPVFGFTAISFANPLAWLFADFMLIAIFIAALKKLSKIPRKELKIR
jgi:putative MATE family efflux protein